MLNVYDYIMNSRFFKTFKVDNLLFVEYKCLFETGRTPYWTHNNYFTYILSGHSKYMSGTKEYVVQKGDALFVRRGTYVAHGHGTGDYCALLIFVSDDFIKAFLDKYPLPRQALAKDGVLHGEDDAIFPLLVDTSLDTYFHSLLSYFSKKNSPSSELLKIKFEELLLSIVSGEQSPSLTTCLRGIHETGKISIRHVMETSFLYNMSLDEYARLCARSLTVFKTEFFAIYKTTPGKWLIQVRLRHAKVLIENTDESVNDIAFKSGFKNTTHFVKVFKDQYGMPPLQYRLSKTKSLAAESVVLTEP